MFHGRSLHVALGICLTLSASTALPQHESRSFSMIEEHKLSEDTRQITALREAGQHNAFCVPVIVQRVFSRKKEEFIIVEPISLDNVPKDKMQDWRIEIRFQEISGGKIKMNMKNKKAIQMLAASREKTRISQAAFVACNYLDKQGRLVLPLIIRANEVSEGYWVSFIRLPETPGGATSVEVGKDLKPIRLIQGR